MCKTKFIALAVVCLLVMSVVGVGLAQELPKSSYTGQILQITKNGSDGISLLVVTQNSDAYFDEIIIHLNAESIIYDQDNSQVSLDTLTVNSTITVIYGPAVTNSLPPQSYGSEVYIIKRSQNVSDGQNQNLTYSGQIMEIIKSDDQEVSVLVKATQSGGLFPEMIFHLNSDSIMRNLANESINLKDLKVGSIITIVYEPAITKSIPPQSHGVEVLVNQEPVKEKVWVFATPDGLKFKASFIADAVLLTLPDQQEVMLPITISASGAKYSNGFITFWNKGREAWIDVAGSSYSTKVIDQYSIPWIQAALKGVTFRAVGQEPGWMFEVDQNQEATLLTNYGQTQIHAPVVYSFLDVQNGLKIYHVTADSENYEVIVQNKEFTDLMSGEKFPNSVMLIIDDHVYRGGGRDLD